MTQVLIHWLCLCGLVFGSVSRSDMSTAVKKRFPFATLAEASDAYQHACASSSQHTIKAKKYDLEFFRSFMAAQGVTSLGAILPTHVRAFIADRVAQGESSATVARRLYTIRHLYSWLRSCRGDYPDPTFGIRAPRIARRAPRWHAERDVDALRAAVAHDPRNAAIVELFLRTGLRCCEMKRLRMKSLDMVSWRLNDVCCKAGVRLDKPLHDDAVRAVLRYLPEREELLRKLDAAFPALPDSLKGEYPVFVSRYRTVAGEPASYELSEKTLWQIVANASGAAEIGHSHPHRLRHTAARRLYESSLDPKLVQDFMGHGSLAMTERYITSAEDAIADAVRRQK